MAKEKKNESNKLLIVVIVLVVFAILSGIIFLALPPKSDDSSATSSDSVASESTTDSEEANTAEATPTEGENLMSGKVNAKIEIENYGTISVELDADAAPITVTNFVDLAKSGFYDGLTFHRIIAGFMMQGGDPLGNGTGGSDKEITGEFSSNGIDNPLSHTKGAISMARSQMPNSASSQFFICHEDATFLDGDYACFGYVTNGQDIVDKVCTDAKPVDNNGTILPEDQPKIVTITIE